MLSGHTWAFLFGDNGNENGSNNDDVNYDDDENMCFYL